jgi:hypothetical protein
MIQSGGWSRMRALDEHVKLACASIDFQPELDAAFEINVAKVRAVLPTELRDRLGEPVEKLVRVAQAAYREHALSAPSHGAKASDPGHGGERALARPALERVGLRSCAHFAGLSAS